jgi:hypothetical protein
MLGGLWNDNVLSEQPVEIEALHAQNLVEKAPFSHQAGIANSHDNHHIPIMT